MAENVLHKLIWNGKYEEVEKLLKSPKGPELARQKDEKGDLPLHLVATIAPMYSSVDSLWSTIDLLLEIHPEGLKEKNKNGDLPLHIITKWLHHTSSRTEKFRAVTNFLRIYPEGAGVKDGKGLLPIEHAFQAKIFDLVNLIAKYCSIIPMKCLALQACQCPLIKTDGCTVCNDKHPLMTRIGDYGGESSSSRVKILNILRVLNLSLAATHHPDDVHKILQLEAQVAELQQQLDSEKQRNQTLNTQNATLQAQCTEIQQQREDYERRIPKQIDGLLSLLVESGAAQTIESCSADLPIPNLKYLIKILCHRLDALLLLSDYGGDDRKPSCAQSLGAYLVEDENASKDMLMQCIHNLFSEYAQAKGGNHQDAAGQCATSTARAQTPGAATRRSRNDIYSSDQHQGSQDDAAGSTSRKKRARVSVKQEQM
jgi:hypothetical protein